MTDLHSGSLAIGPISRQQIAAFAVASGDDNRIHLDEEVARANGMPGIIVHGMHLEGQILEKLSHLFGDATIVASDCRFQNMAFPDRPYECRWSAADKASALEVNFTLLDPDETVIVSGTVSFGQ